MRLMQCPSDWQTKLYKYLLQAAGNAVMRATDNLVRAAQQAIQQEEERSLVLNRRMAVSYTQDVYKIQG